MTLLSVVIPIHDVEPYLAECLRSVANQTVGDLEAIMVDDGSTDGSAELAEQFAARDRRFRLIRQANGGLGKARNTGIEAASGEFLAFVDSDDVLPRNGYELLLEPLMKTGSDFATGNVRRLTSGGTTRSSFVQKVFGETRLKTHVTKFRPLITDRIVPNKVWRRSFWDAHGFRFPEGMLHEDIPVVVPAQFAARSVDVIADPVYLYRIREGEDRSITQRRADKRALVDRVRAIDDVRDYLTRHAHRRGRRWYDRSVIAEDLSYYLNVLDNADDEYRAIFLEQANIFLDRAGRRACAGLRAIDRLKWHLVRRRLMPELLEVLRFQRERMSQTPPLRSGRRWYGDYPFRTDRRLGIPRSVYRLDRELTLTPHVEGLRFDDDGALEIRGHAYIDGIGAAGRDAQRVTISALRPGRFRRIRLRTFATRLGTSVAHRPDVRSRSCDAQWSGFEATLDPRRLRRLGRWRENRWQLYATVRAGGVTRRRVAFQVDGPRPIYAVERVMPEGVAVSAVPTRSSRIEIRVAEHWATLRAHSLANGVVELHGEIQASGADGVVFCVGGLTGSPPLQYPLAVEEDARPASFAVRLPLAAFRTYFDSADQNAHAAEGDDETACDLWIGEGDRRYRVTMADDVREAVWPFAPHELSLYRNREGHATLAARAPHLVVTDAGWTSEGSLEIRGGMLASERPPHELVLLARDTGERRVLPLRQAGAGRFEAHVPPSEVSSPAETIDLRVCSWDLYTGRIGEDGDARMPSVTVGQAMYSRLPARTVSGGAALTFGMTPERRAFLTVERDLDEE